MREERKKRVTIDMVSQRAQVSKTTISRYLNGKYEYMSEDTRKRIEQAIEELDYHPNAMARGLKSNKTGLIGLIVGDITNPFSSILVKAVGDTCTKFGYQVLIANTDDDGKKEQEYIRSMLDRQVEGLIVNTAGGNDAFLAEMQGQGIRIVLADRILQDNTLDTVTTDVEQVTAQLLELVYQEGFERIAFFSQTFRQNSTRRRRYETYAKVALRHGQNPDEYVYLIGSKEGEFDCTQALELLLDSSRGLRTAVFTVNGVVLLDLLNAVKELGLSVPDDVGICSYDGWDWAGIVGDGISTISHPSYEVGQKSVELLIKRINSKKEYPPRYVELKSQIQLRGSTALK